MSEASDPVTIALTGQLAFVLITSALLALLLSLACLAVYKRAVIRAMRRRASGSDVHPTQGPTTDSAGVPGQGPLSINISTRSLNALGASATSSLFNQARRRPWEAALVLGIAGIFFSAVMSLAFFQSSKIEPNWLSLLALAVSYVWPAALTTIIVAAQARRTKLAILVLYFLIFALINAIAMSFSPTLRIGHVILYWAVYNVPPSLLLMIFLNRRIRAVGPLVLTFMIVGVTGATLAASLAGSNERILRSMAEIGFSLGLGATGVFLGIHILGFIPFAILAWLTLHGVRRLYEQKRISDQTLTVDSVWLTFGLANSIGFVFSGAWWILSGLFAFLIFKLSSSAGFKLLRKLRTNTPGYRKLLLLRVFALGRRSEALYGKLGKSWRTVGSIQLIAGPDLATSTVEPHEFLDFVSGRMARRFIDSAQALELGISRMDLQPDADNRLRVNDFFCHDDTWRMTLARLANECDAVLMDLRGFSDQHAGCVFEINELFNLLPLQRVVFAIDETTDQKFLEMTMRQAWSGMRSESPNRRSTPAEASLVQLDRASRGHVDNLLYALCRAAEINLAPAECPLRR